MAEQQYNPDEEDYQMQSSETSTDAFSSGDKDAAAGSAAGSNASDKMRRYVLIGIGLLVLVVGVYQFMGMFFTKPKTQIRPAGVQQAAAPTPPPVATTEPSAQQAAKVEAQLRQRISQLEARPQPNNQAVGNLSTQLSSLEGTINNVNNKLTDLNYNVQQLSNKLSAQQQQIAELKKHLRRRVVKKRRRVKVARRARKLEHYSLVAIIPGRAWIKSSEGSTLTVGEGSSIPGYGTVRLIDPHQGEVRTSRGTVIGFGSKDK